MNVTIFGWGYGGLFIGTYSRDLFTRVCLAEVGNPWCSTREPAEGGITLY